jgi:electron transport complex protein RnfB
MSALADAVLALLPQTQCTRCGYPNCAAYAQAVAENTAAINQCPPGGQQGIEWLAAVTGQAVLALNPAHGVEGPRRIAFVDEAWCIGCTLCNTACPTDAIIGSNKLMHTVIETYCTGCELCLPVCPVDCIELENATASTTGWDAWSRGQADLARQRYEFSSYRRKRSAVENSEWLEKKEVTKLTELSSRVGHSDLTIQDKKRVVIEAALLHARAQRGSGKDVA